MTIQEQLKRFRMDKTLGKLIEERIETETDLNKKKYLDKVYQVSKKLLPKLIYSKQDGYICCGLPKSQDGAPVELTNIYDNMKIEGDNYWDLVDYLSSAIELHLKSHMNSTDNDLGTVIQRATLSFPSFMRERDIVERFEKMYPDIEVIRNSDLDIKGHSDFDIKINNNIYHVWSYNKTKEAAIRTYDKLRGIHGEISDGYNYLFPFDSKNSVNVNNWYLYSDDDIKELYNTILSNKSDMSFDSFKMSPKKHNICYDKLVIKK